MRGIVLMELIPLGAEGCWRWPPLVNVYNGLIPCVFLICWWLMFVIIKHVEVLEAKDLKNNDILNLLIRSINILEELDLEWPWQFLQLAVNSYFQTCVCLWKTSAKIWSIKLIHVFSPKSLKHPCCLIESCQIV